MIRHLALFLLAASTPLSAAPLPRSYSVTSFDRVRVEGPYLVTLSTNRAPFARAIGSPAQLDAIDLRVEGRTLIVRQRSGAVRNGESGRVEIAVGTPDLRSALLVGSGRLRIDRLKGLEVALGLQGSGVLTVADVQADRVGGAVEGSGKMELAGRSKSATLSARGTGTMRAEALRTAEVTAAADGAAELSAFPAERATVSATGTAMVQLSGSAACTLKVSGSASVSGCGKVR